MKFYRQFFRKKKNVCSQAVSKVDGLIFFDVKVKRVKSLNLKFQSGIVKESKMKKKVFFLLVFKMSSQQKG